jgi:hypothetical protein
VRRASRAEAVWLEELGPEARARKASLLSAWVEAAEGLRSAIHAHESERGPLVEALFPVWRAPSLRRHADQALAAEKELQRRLSSAYVVRRLAELATQSAVGPALETVAAAGAAWAAERDRPALSGAEADEVRARLLAVAGKGAHLLERVRWVSRAALTRRPDLLDTVFPKRARAESPGEGESTEHAGTSSAEPAEVAAELPAHVAFDAAPQAIPPQGDTARAGVPPRASRREASATATPDASTEHGPSRPSGQRVTADPPGTRRPSRRRASAEKTPAVASAAPDARPAPRKRSSAEAATSDAPGEHGRPRPSRRGSAENAPAAQDARPASRRRPPDASRPRAPDGGARRKSRPARKS